MRRAGWPPRRRAGAGIDGADHVDELARRVQRPGRDDAARDAAREALLAVARDQRRASSSDVVAVHDVGRGERLLGVHAHVERRVEAIREPALGTVELRAAHPEIHQDAHRALSLAVTIDQLGELFEPTFDHVRPRPEGCETKTSGRCGVGVTVDSEQAQVGPRVEKRCGMAGATHGAIDDQSVRHGQEELHHLPDHHREMRELRLHIRLLEPFRRNRTCRRPRLQPPGRQAPPGMSPRVGNG